MTELRTTVVIDYQNVHLVGVGLFHPGAPSHEHLVHPLTFALNLVALRNHNQAEGRPEAVLERVLVYRGLPSAAVDPKPYARNLEQQIEWQRDARVSVLLRPLKYSYEKTSEGRKALDANGKWIVSGKQEKGVDVLCALALVREARVADISLVILASQDTDLEPALDESIALHSAKFAHLLVASGTRDLVRKRSRHLWTTRRISEERHARSQRQGVISLFFCTLDVQKLQVCACEIL